MSQKLGSLSCGARSHVRGATVAAGSLGAGGRGPWGTVRRLLSREEDSSLTAAPSLSTLYNPSLTPNPHPDPLALYPCALHAAAHHRRSEARRLVVRLVIGLSD